MRVDRLLIFVMAFAVSPLSQHAVADTADSGNPHIILFFVDDFGQRDLSCYGSSLYETPHMDQLAAEGTRFTDAYAAYPRCVPSRQGLLTGKYPSRIENEANESGDHQHHVPLSEVTFGEAMKEHGYQTCYIGKWHLGKEGGGPGNQGFDTVIHAGSAGATGDYFFPFPTEKGLSVVNPVDGHDGDHQREPMFWYKWQARPDSTGDTRALSLIDGKFKLIQWIDEDLVELFDLSQDVGERKNLASKLPERTAEMSKSLNAMEQGIGNLREKGLEQLQRRLSRTRQRNNKSATAALPKETNE